MKKILVKTIHGEVWGMYDSMEDYNKMLDGLNEQGFAEDDELPHFVVEEIEVEE